MLEIKIYQTENDIDYLTWFNFSSTKKVSQPENYVCQNCTTQQIQNHC